MTSDIFHYIYNIVLEYYSKLSNISTDLMRQYGFNRNMIRLTTTIIIPITFETLINSSRAFHLIHFSFNAVI